MTVIVWIVSFITNLLSPIGMFILAGMCAEGNITTQIFIIPGIAAVIGLIFGFIAWSENVAPRMFWVKSRTELFQNRVGSAFGYAFSFFFTAGLLESIPWLVNLFDQL